MDRGHYYLNICLIILKTKKKRHHVKPGITGYAQVNGRNHIDWDTKLKFDADYVDRLSFKLDMNILFKTIYKVIASKDVATDNTLVENMLSEQRENEKLVVD